MRVLYLILTAVIAYFLGGVNGSAIVSHYVFRGSRNRPAPGSGMAGFYRAYGPVGVALVLIIDVLKAVIAVLIGGALLGIVEEKTVGRLFAGFCLTLGSCYPVLNLFRGGKGVLCAGIMALMVDWRVGLCCWVAFIVVVIFTRYLSLSSMVAALLCPIFMWIFQYTGLQGTLALLTALIILVKHGENILRLIGGTEPKLDFGKKTADRKDYDDYEDEMY